MTDLMERDPNDSGEVIDLALSDQDTRQMPAAGPRCGTETEELGRYMGPEWPPLLRRPDADGKKLYAPEQPKPSKPLPPPPPKPSYAGHLPPSDPDGPETYIGRHRAPDDLPMPGTWQSGLASAVRAGWARVRGAF